VFGGLIRAKVSSCNSEGQEAQIRVGLCAVQCWLALCCYISLSSSSLLLSFGIRACCDLIVLFGPECVDAMSVELSCHRQVQMRFQ
jgi:hypothetical protein